MNDRFWRLLARALLLGDADLCREIPDYPGDTRSAAADEPFWLSDIPLRPQITVIDCRAGREGAQRLLGQA